MFANINFKEKNFISINPDLKEVFGHYLHYDLKVKKNIPEGSFIILGNKDLNHSIKKEYPFTLPIFSKTTYDDIPLLDLKSLETFKSELAKAIQSINKQSKEENIFYMYMGSIWHALALLEISLKYPNPKNTFYINLFHHRSQLLASGFSTSKYFQEYQAIFDICKKNESSSKVILCSDTNLAQKTFLKYFGYQTKYFPMFSVSPLEEYQKIKIDPKTDDRLIVYYAGNVQEDKGFDLMVELFERVPNDEFIFRCRDHINYDHKMQPYVNRLKANKNVELISGKLSNEEYGKLLMEADILLIPYRKKAFEGRTSGIYVDALLLGKPMITIRETWMGSWTIQFKNGEIFPDGNVDGFEKALLQVGADYQKYQTNTIEAKHYWEELNGIKNFIHFLNTPTEQVVITHIQQSLFDKELDICNKKIKTRQPNEINLIVNKLRRTSFAKNLKKRWNNLKYQ